MKIAYFDCFAGASGDMILGALMDAGLPADTLKTELDKLGLTHYDLQLKKVLKRGIGGSQAVVIVDEDHHGHHHRHLSHIREIISTSTLDEAVKAESIRIFQRLAEAEAKVHRTSIEKIHFHEVGAMDAIIDVVGAVAGFAALGIQKICCSPMHLGTGTVKCAHGVLPVPAPATAELVKGFPVYSTGVEGELLTPTGAAILTTLASTFGPMPPMSVQKIGYGAGTTDPSLPNFLRVSIGAAPEDIADCEIEHAAVIETNIDDMNPQIYDHVIAKILEMGAMDIYLTPVQMKKNRSGTLLTVICDPQAVNKFADFLLRETTTIGMRWRIENRLKAIRLIKKLDTRFGPVRFKYARLGNETVNITPEYDDCKRIALENKIPLKEVMAELNSLSRN
ncbi:nickel pincer cofactor biosynthesis protein LarC [Desulfococcaceae bacterium HSG9]|nr:nickel pincer cofactor biosynthesis protein LarC [Desulfococcaceae bacterium HSG9]